MIASRLLLVRHGESTWNAEKRWQGWGDPPLSACGRAQAAALAAGLASSGIVRLVSSDLARAAQTASILGAALGVAPVFDARLRERNLGRWTGLTQEEIAVRFGNELRRLRTREPGFRPDGGESHEEFAARASPALLELAASEPGGATAVVTHLGVIRLVVPEHRPDNAEVVAFEPARVIEALASR